MTATAAHLVDHVFPETPVRQWVLSLPYPLRLPCAFDKELMASIRPIFVRAVFSCTARRARALGLPPSPLGFRTGAVNFVQRTGGALNLNPHLHALFIDGVYTRDCPLSRARFHELPPPPPRLRVIVYSTDLDGHNWITAIWNDRSAENSLWFYPDSDTDSGDPRFTCALNILTQAATVLAKDGPAAGLDANGVFAIPGSTPSSDGVLT